MKNNKSNFLWIMDNDDTLVDSGRFLRPAHILGIMQATGKSFEESEKIFLEKGVQIVEDFGISIGNFYQDIYPAPNYEGLGKHNIFKAFEDAKRFLNKYDSQTVVVSNIKESVTQMKLKATGINAYNYVAVLGAANRTVRKPNLYLAQKSIEAMNKKGIYHPNKPLIVVGDMSYDVEFAENIKNNIHKNTIGILLDRGHSDEMKVKPDFTIKSLDELYDLNI